jgi:hypothetical protein
MNIAYQCAVCPRVIEVNSLSTLILDYALHLKKHEIQGTITPNQYNELMARLYREHYSETTIRPLE